MNALMKNLVLCSTAIVTVAILAKAATPSYAQRDAGAKARGEFGTGFWNSKSESGSFSPSRMETRRSYSYEPTATVAGYKCDASQVAPAECAAAQPQVGRRSFSHDPSRQSFRIYSTPKKAPWQYPKTDPRRYRP